MDWTFPFTGLDLTYVWDPELWLQFKQAVVWNSPEIFWDKLWDRISYSKCQTQTHRQWLSRWSTSVVICCITTRYMRVHICWLLFIST